MSGERDLDWEGCANVRDLGGLPTADGRITRRGAFVRGAAAERLSAAGWEALREHGIRTIVDLRNDDELGRDAAPRPPGVGTLHVPLDTTEDREFWDVWETGPQFGTPLYYGPFLERFPQATARVLAALAAAPEGGVLYHCMGGRDRTGLITILLLALARVEPEEIAADYALSTGPDSARIEAFLRERGTTGAGLVVDLLASLDVEAYLRAAGLSDGDVAALRERLVA